MTTFAQLRKTALSLLETGQEAGRSGTVVFTVRGKRFASTGGDDDVHLLLPEGEADEFLAAHPGAERLTHGGKAIGVRVGLADINGQQLNHWVRRAWLSRAPKRLSAQAAAADPAAAGGVGDLPRAIGRPATRALAAAGITTLAQVAELTEAELRAMHGVGPKAVGVLGEALAAGGRSFKR
ncbi:hypothetical protein [Spirillospora sp. NPDC029432]|uniref:hypothetical protein n=1 Tax=Spirillospora sp. NPDC029432 TaxID=3154599 RepID=UPI00345186EC